MRRWITFWSAAAAIAAGGASFAAEENVNEACLKCHSEEAISYLPVTFGDGQETSAFLDREALTASVHAGLACVECHHGFEASEHPGRKLPSRDQYVAQIMEQCRRCHTEGGPADVPRIVGVLHPAGVGGTPHCSNCHLPHQVRKAAAAAVASRVCAACHEETFQKFAASAHGAALEDPPNSDLPACTTCHESHQSGGKSLAARRVRAGRPCIGCHENEQLMRKYNLSTDVVTTYLKDFHGVSVQLSRREDDTLDLAKYTSVCADCHGIHDVHFTANAGAAAMKEKMLTTCRKCHPDATANFPSAWLSHYEPSLSKNALVYLVKVGYQILIPFVITGLVLHILFHFWAYLRAKRRTGGLESFPHEPLEIGPDVPQYLPRFTTWQRLEHLVAITTFGVLVLTGLPQRFHDAAWSAHVVSWLGGIDMTRLMHRVAGIAFTVAAVVHLTLAARSVVLNKKRMTMVPGEKDFRDALATLQFYLGWHVHFPKFDRFDYRQKFEYWGLVLGGTVMAMSGLVLLYPTIFTHWLPGQFVAAAKVAHSYEAMMALLTIVIWHMYGARFDSSIFTGKISARQLADHHPLEFERLTAHPAGQATNQMQTPA